MSNTNAHLIPQACIRNRFLVSFYDNQNLLNFDIIPRCIRCIAIDLLLNTLTLEIESDLKGEVDQALSTMLNNKKTDRGYNVKIVINPCPESDSLSGKRRVFTIKEFQECEAEFNYMMPNSNTTYILSAKFSNFQIE